MARIGGLDAHYWEKRYHQGKTGWDIGHASRPLVHIIDGLEDQSQKILVPGAGNAFEVEYLWAAGFRYVYLLDWADYPLQQFAKRNPSFPTSQLLQMDFFELDDEFDIILEQTFFCSLPPMSRPDYVQKMHALLKDGGGLTGVLFNVPLYKDRPPFGGDKQEYRSLFSELFEISVMQPCTFSEPDRQGMEVYFKLTKKLVK